jgi:hypothetical protein
MVAFVSQQSWLQTYHTFGAYVIKTTCLNSCGMSVQDKPEQLVGLLLLHIKQHGGLAAAHDLVMLGDLLASLMAADMAKHQGGTSGSSSKSWMQAAGQGAFMTPETALKHFQGLSAVQQHVLVFILQCLQLLPVPVAASVAGEVLLRPLTHVLAWEPEVVHWALLVSAVAADTAAGTSGSRVEAPAAASTSALLKRVSSAALKGRCVGARQRLHALGFTALGVAAWQDDCLSSVARQVEVQHRQQQQQQEHQQRQQQQQQPAAAQPTAGDSPGLQGLAAARLSQQQAPVVAGTTEARNAAELQQLGADSGSKLPAAAGTSDEVEEGGSAAAASAAADVNTTPAAAVTTLQATPPVAALPAEAAESAAAADVLAAATGGLDDGSAANQVDTELANAASPTVGITPSDRSQALADANPAAHDAPPPAADTAVDLGQISDPCQRLIEERRRLRGVGMDLQGEVSSKRAGPGPARVCVHHEVGRACQCVLCSMLGACESGP